MKDTAGHSSTETPMRAHDEPPHDEALHQFAHDLQNCLHVVGMGLEILKDVRNDDARFAEISDWVRIEHRKGVELLEAYVHAADVPPA